MLTRNQMISLNTDAKSARSDIVASTLRVYVINHLVAALKWRTCEQRARE